MRSNVLDDNAKDPAIDAKEQQACQPKTGNKGGLAQKL